MARSLERESFMISAANAPECSDFDETRCIRLGFVRASSTPMFGAESRPGQVRSDRAGPPQIGLLAKLQAGSTSMVEKGCANAPRRRCRPAKQARPRASPLRQAKVERRRERRHKGAMAMSDGISEPWPVVARNREVSHRRRPSLRGRPGRRLRRSSPSQIGASW